MHIHAVRSILIVCCAVLAATAAGAATKGRIIPDGSVALLKNGAVTKFTEQTVLDENALMACEGACMVKMQGISLVAMGGTRFAVKESDGMVNLYVGQGRVAFVLADPGQTFAFYIPDGRHLQTEGFLVPASNDRSVKGFFDVTETAAEIGMERGSMIVSTENGRETVQAGQSIKLAQAEVPSIATSGGEKEANSPKSGLIPPWSSMSRGQQITVIAVGAAAGAWVASETFLDTSSNPHPASPNQ
ncbi:MAG: hypothetical protein RBR09_12475 [Desulfobulbaceae bacterium]|jgi:hypothetical protein|nr:hypothetical protein [Desulfobulbaceae bacterium]MDY0352065.1 hypothetical protein [Desulfobulbaceae bacterium]